MVDLSRPALSVTTLLAAALLAGCTTAGADDPAPASDGRASPAAATVAAEPAGQEYRYRGYVIGRTDADEATLCDGFIAQSLPPQCSGATARGWDWSQVTAESESGTSFGDVEVVGTWDPATTTLTVTRPLAVPVPKAADAPLPVPTADFSTPCPEPPGGWESLVPTAGSPADFDAAYAAVQQVEGVTVAWYGRNPGSARPTWVALNVRTTGEVEAVEAEARKYWSGPLCVVGDGTRTKAELEQIEAELRSEPDLLSVNAFDMEEHVDATMWVVPDGFQAELDARYGEGAVQVHGFLEPVD